MHGNTHGTSCGQQLFFGAVPHCASSESSPLTASAKQKHLTKHELEEQEEWNERAKREDTKGKAALVDKAREEASKRQANLQNGRHKRLYRKAGFMV